MREFVVRPEPLLTPVQTAERMVADVLAKTDPEQGILVTIRGMPGSGVDRVLQGALGYARERQWLEYFVGLVPWELEVPYSALERVCLRIEGLRHLLPDLAPDHSPIELGQRVLDALDAHLKVDDRPLLMVFDHLEHCDRLSSIVFRYVIMRATARGANFVLGDSLASEADISDELRQAVCSEPNAHLMIIPDFSPADIVTFIGQYASAGVSISEGERVWRLTGGRFDAIVAYLESVDEEHLADLAAIRALPSVTSARITGAPELHLDDLPESTRLAAEVCALHPGGVSMQMLKLVANRMGMLFSMETAADGQAVIISSLSSMLHLYDPLNAPDIIDHMDVERRRIIHSALADHTFGNDSRIHSILAGPIDDQAVGRILEAAAGLESTGNGKDALELLDVAIDRVQEKLTTDAACSQLLRKVGHVLMRQTSPVSYQERIADFAKFADQDEEFALFYLWVRTVKAHGRLDAREARLEYLSKAPVSVDHEFMQAEVARMELLAAVQTGPAATLEAAESVRTRFRALLGRRPENPELQWIEPKERLLAAESVVLLFATAANVIADAPDQAREIANQAQDRDENSAEAVDALTAAGIILGGTGHIDEAAKLVEEARRRQTRVTRATLMGGQLDVLELDLLFRRGEFNEMRSFVDSALARAFEGLDLPTRISVPAFKAWLLAANGNLDGAERYLSMAKNSDRYRFPGYATDILAIADARITRMKHGVAQALNVVELAAREPRNQGSLRIRALMVELLAAEGRLEEANRTWGEIVYIKDLLGWGEPAEYAWLGGLLAVGREDYDTALHIFQQGLRDSRSEFVLGKCHLALANVYSLKRGHNEAVQEHFEKCRIAFAAIGAKAYVDEAAEQWSRVASASHERVAALTRRERQVATLAAQGWRNKEIARELSIGVATVAFHMSNALEKLGIAKRSELPSVIE